MKLFSVCKDKLIGSIYLSFKYKFNIIIPLVIKNVFFPIYAFFSFVKRLERIIKFLYSIRLPMSSHALLKYWMNDSFLSHTFVFFVSLTRRKYLNISVSFQPLVSLWGFSFTRPCSVYAWFMLMHQLVRSCAWLYFSVTFFFFFLNSSTVFIC